MKYYWLLFEILEIFLSDVSHLDAIALPKIICCLFGEIKKRFFTTLDNANSHTNNSQNYPFLLYFWIVGYDILVCKYYQDP